MKSSLLISLGLTIVIELLISFLMGIRRKQDIKIVVCANICTNPLVVYIANVLLVLCRPTAVVIAVLLMEIGVCIAEGYIYKKCLAFYKKSPYLLSVINNILSFSIGLLWNIMK